MLLSKKKVLRPSEVRFWRRAERGLSGCGRKIALPVAILGVWVAAVGAAAEHGMGEVQVVPSHPTTEDPIVLVLSGTWVNSCVPQAPKVAVLGDQITVTTSNLSEICLTVLTPWQLTVPIGTLSSPGWYSLVVVHNGQPIGGIEFEVRTGKDGSPPPAMLVPVVGVTDDEGRFAVAMLTPMAAQFAGRLFDLDGEPIARQPVALSPKDASGRISGSVDGIASIEVAVAGYIPTEVAEFTRVTFLFVTMVSVGDLCLCRAPDREEGGALWRVITWDDFEGTPPEGADKGLEAARIAVFLRHAPKKVQVWYDKAARRWKARYTKIEVTNFMDKSQSWVLPGSKTAALLNHEQKHFDLNEVYRRLLQAALEKLEGEGDTQRDALKDLSKKVAETTAKFEAEARKQQKRYDEETDNGRSAEKQAEWDKRIAGWLVDPSTAPQP